MPSVWIKAGVHGEMSPELGRGFRKVKRIFHAAGESVYITSIAEGTHSMATRHQCGINWSDAVDIRPGPHELFQAVKLVLGDDFDVINEGNHWHIEWDID